MAAGLGLVLFSLANSYWHFLLIVTVVFAGTTVGFSRITLLSTVNQWFVRRKPVAMATLMTMFAVGAGFAPLLVAVGMDRIGWRSTMLFSGIFFCALTALAGLALRSRPEDMGLRPDGEEKAPSSPDFTVWEAMRTGAFWALVLGGMVLNAAEDTTIEDISPVLAAVMAVLPILLTFGLRVAAGKISPRKILSCALAIGGLGHVALLLQDGDAGAVVFLSALAVVQGCSAVYWIMVGDFFGRSKFASLMGLLLLLRAVAVFVPLVIAGVLERTSYYDISMILYILVYGTVAVAVWSARRPSLPRSESGGEPAAT